MPKGKYQYPMPALPFKRQKGFCPKCGNLLQRNDEYEWCQNDDCEYMQPLNEYDESEVETDAETNREK
jgi:hypothetical protein